MNRSSRIFCRNFQMESYLLTTSVHEYQKLFLKFPHLLDLIKEIANTLSKINYQIDREKKSK